MKRLIQEMVAKINHRRLPKELIQHSQAELDNAQYDMADVFFIDMEYIPIDPQTFKGVQSKSIIAVRAYKNWFMDIESGKYYECGCNIKEINRIGFYMKNQRPLRFYCHREVLDNHIDWNSKITAKQCRYLLEAKANDANNMIKA